MKRQNTTKHVFSIGLFLAMFLFILPLVAVAQGKIAFTTCGVSDGSCEIYLMNPDGSNQINLTNTPGNDVSPSISPDGSKIAFSSRRDGNYEIYVMNIDGSNQTRLTFDPGVDEEPSFGPNGKIAFTSDRDVTDNVEIYIMNADGSGQTRLTTGVGSAGSGNPSISHNGNRIVFSFSLGPGFDSDIYVMNADGSGRTRLTFNTAIEGDPSFSPDDTRIAFRVANGTPFGSDIWTMNADGSGHARLTNSLDANSGPAFSPDGSKIAFLSDRGPSPLTGIYIMNVNGSNQTQITNIGGSPSWGVQALPPNTPPTITAINGTVTRDSNTPNVSIATVNDAEDAENILGITINGSPLGATVNGVTVAGLSISPSGNVTATIRATCSATNASFTLTVIDTGSLFSQTTLNVTVTKETTAPTLTLPANIITSLPPNSNDTSKVINFTVSATDNCDPNPIVMAVPPSGSAFPVGTTIVNVSATDASGNTATGSFTVTVLYNFAGFFPPIQNLPLVNTVNAGQSIPVKFSLSGDKGLNIFAVGYPVSQQIGCTGGGAAPPIEGTETAGSSTLSYDPRTDQYIYVWQTERAWAGTCRQLQVRLNDGSLYIANFQFR